MDFFSHINPFYENVNIPDMLEIAGAWRDDLMIRRNHQLQLINDRDIDGYYDLSRKMFYNELIAGLWSFGYDYNKIFINRNFIHDINNVKKITSCANEKLGCTKAWDIWGLGIDVGGKERVISYVSPNHYLQAYNINNLILTINRSTQSKLIVDLGSGFGGMANILAELCKEKLRIVLFDIPLNLATAFIYLSHIYGLERVYLIKEEKELSLIDSNHIDNTCFYLVPTSMVKPYSYYFSSNIVHNVHSFSEMDKISVDFYLKYLANEKLNYFIETNSNVLGSLNFGGHVEVLSRDIVLPEYYQLLARFSESDNSRYVTSIWSNKLLQ